MEQGYMQLTRSITIIKRKQPWELARADFTGLKSNQNRKTNKQKPQPTKKNETTMKQNQKKRSKNENTTHVKQTRTENSDIRNCRVINKDRCQGPEGTNRPKMSCSVPTEIHSLCPWAWGAHFSHVLGVFTPRPISSPLVD